jgi:ATP-dependent RNA helicase DeaD
VHEDPTVAEPESVTSDTAQDQPKPNFATLGLPPAILDQLARLGFTTPTDIQAATIPVLLAGKDAVGVAQTGTGKTAAFGLPLMASLDKTVATPQAMVLTPTRELAIQVSRALEDFAPPAWNVTIQAIYGGAPYLPQKRALQAGVQVIVGTPGRVIDHMERGTLDLTGVRFMVLDEGDEMLRMGFAEEVDRILGQMPQDRQTALFSATLPPAIRRTVETHLHHPQTISVAPQSSTVTTIEQRFAIVPGRHKVTALMRVLATTDADATLVFTQTKAMAETIGTALVSAGVAASVISGNVAQAERERIVDSLRDGRLRVLVATDVAARGLDVDRIGLVINFDTPREVESYVHRIGRTGRAGRLGVALSFITPKERDRLRKIEKVTSAKLLPWTIPTVDEVTNHRINRLLERAGARRPHPSDDLIRQAVNRYIGAEHAWYEESDPPADSGNMTTDNSAGNDQPSAMDLAVALLALGVKLDQRRSSADRDMDQELAQMTRRGERGRRGDAHTGDRPSNGRRGARKDRDDSADRNHDRHRPTGRDHTNRDATTDDHFGSHFKDWSDKPDRRDRGGRRSDDSGDRRHSERSERGSYGERHDRGSDHHSERDRGGKSRRSAAPVRYWLGVGRRHGVRPGAIIGAMANEGGIDGRDLGALDLFANYSIIEVSQPLSRDRIRRLSRTIVNGQELRIRPDTDNRRR